MEIYLTFVTTASLDTAYRIWYHIPISCDRVAVGRCSCVTNLLASERISMTLFSKANTGARGKAATKIVTKPNCNTGKKEKKYNENKKYYRFLFFACDILELPCNILLLPLDFMYICIDTVCCMITLAIQQMDLQISRYSLNKPLLPRTSNRKSFSQGSLVLFAFVSSS